jgi:MoxR-like ATPase
MDRFLIRARMSYPDAAAEREVLRAHAGAARLDEIRSVLNGEDVLAMQEEVKAVRVDDSLVDYALRIVQRTRESQQLSLGVSPRGSLMLYRAAQAMAYLDGRGYCTPEDFKTLAVPVFAHRVVVSARYSSTLKKSEQSDEVLREIIASVSVPV